MNEEREFNLGLDYFTMAPNNISHFNNDRTIIRESQLISIPRLASFGQIFA